MPVEKVDGGFKWGSHGKLYKGKGARKAARHGRDLTKHGAKETVMSDEHMAKKLFGGN